MLTVLGMMSAGQLVKEHRKVASSTSSTNSSFAPNTFEDHYTQAASFPFNLTSFLSMGHQVIEVEVRLPRVRVIFLHIHPANEDLAISTFVPMPKVRYISSISE